MIPFFRKIRKKYADENRQLKYFKYALGEIVLVMLGILLALQVNNWNESNNESNLINNYYQRLHSEFENTVEYLNFQINVIDTLSTKNKRSLYLLNLKNKDSLVHLKESLGALGTAYNTNLSLPMFEEFLNEGFLAKVKNDSIKLQMQFLRMSMKHSDFVDSYTNDQYHTSIEPYFYRKINYSEVVDSSMNLISGGPETNYEQFLNNLELWNLLTFKQEILQAHEEALVGIVNVIESLDDSVVKELKN